MEEKFEKMKCDLCLQEILKSEKTLISGRLIFTCASLGLIPKRLRLNTDWASMLGKERIEGWQVFTARNLNNDWSLCINCATEIEHLGKKVKKVSDKKWWQFWI